MVGGCDSLSPEQVVPEEQVIIGTMYSLTQSAWRFEVRMSLRVWLALLDDDIEPIQSIVDGGEADQWLRIDTDARLVELTFR